MTVRPRLYAGDAGARARGRRAVRHQPLLLLHRQPGERDAELAQKLGQPQPFAPVFRQGCVGQLAVFGPT